MAELNLTGIWAATADGVLLRVKVIPGASRTRLAGLLGDRLKIQVAAPPEGGRANAAVCELLAEIFSLPKRQVTVEAGHTQPQKSVMLTGLSLCQATETLGRLLEGRA